MLTSPKYLCLLQTDIYAASFVRHVGNAKQTAYFLTGSEVLGGKRGANNADKLSDAN